MTRKVFAPVPTLVIACLSVLVVAVALLPTACRADICVQYTPIDLTPHLNGYVEGSLSPATPPPRGEVFLGGVPFSIPAIGYDIIATASESVNGPTSGTVETSVPRPAGLHVLLNTTWSYLAYAGTRIGSMTAVYSDGSRDATPLVLGGNVRDMGIHPDVVSTVTDPANQEVWRGIHCDPSGFPAVWDMLTIPLDPNKTLVGIAFMDESTSIDPGLFIGGMTVASNRLSLSPAGDSWHMITLPWACADPAPGSVFDELLPPLSPLDVLSGCLHRYDHYGQRYETYWRWAPGPFGAITPGDGYWLWLFEPATICYRATPPGEPVIVHFPTSGWYLCGSPRAEDVPVAACTVYHAADPPRPFADAANVWIMDPLLWYDAGSMNYVSCGVRPIDADHHLRAFRGYWLYTFVDDVTLEIPPP